MDDLIRRQDAIRAVINTSIPFSAMGRTVRQMEGLKHDVVGMIRSLPSADRPTGKWVPCSERLPEMYDKKLFGDYDNSEAVIVTYLYHGKLYVSECGILYCSDGMWRYLGMDDEAHEMEDSTIMAWMTLPEPYRPESEVQK